MANAMVAITILLIISLAIVKIVTEKRKGIKCVGCPLSGDGCSVQNKTKNKALQRIEVKVIP